MAALIAATGQNPRKPASTTVGYGDLIKELADVVVTALSAIEHVRGNDGSSLDILAGHLNYITDRAGIAF